MPGKRTKYDAYKHIASDYNEAVKILKDKKLAYGEPAVVSFYYPSINDSDKQIMTALGIGSMGDDPETICRISNDSSTIIDIMQQKIDSIIRYTSRIDLEITPSIIHSGTDTSVNIASTVDTAGQIESIVLKKNGSIVEIGHDSSISYEFLANENSNCIIAAECFIDDFSVSCSSTLYVVDPIYYGFGDVYTDASIMAVPKLSPIGQYIINILDDDSHVIFNVPSHMEIKNATVNGLGMPLLAPSYVQIDGKPYKSYISTNTYTTGILVVVINDNEYQPSNYVEQVDPQY